MTPESQNSEVKEELRRRPLLGDGLSQHVSSATITHKS